MNKPIPTENSLLKLNKVDSDETIQTEKINFNNKI